jgi:hypothetical protein
MKRHIPLLLLLTAWVAYADHIDRIAVTVDKHVIAESDVIRYIQVAAFLDSKVPDLSGPQKREAAARLVDQYLLLQDAELTRAPLPDLKDVDPLLEQVRMRYGSANEYQAAMERAGITEEELKAHLLAGLRMLRYTEFRFRSEVQLTENELRDFYLSLPEDQRRGSSFESHQKELETLLLEQRAMQALDQWLKMTRQDARIEYREGAFQ